MNNAPIRNSKYDKQNYCNHCGAWHKKVLRCPDCGRRMRTKATRLYAEQNEQRLKRNGIKRY